eukprot:TRINITY_DN1235_c0_g1_i2.p2 TRINITY_DN1235_c0_g1~~TRINITY_DN1235_c0_g1_i2.p2  ORF type:complete len:120 (-),score=25.86 TRINITY_DN1235_c0_g1_i2:109-468(-)
MSNRMYPLKVKFDFQEGDGPSKDEIESILNSKEGQEALERAFKSVTGKDDVVIHGSPDAMARAEDKGGPSPGPGQAMPQGLASSGLVTSSTFGDSGMLGNDTHGAGEKCTYKYLSLIHI